MERGGNRWAPPPVRRSTHLHLGTTTGVLTLRRHSLGWRPLHCGLSGLPISLLAMAPDHPMTVFAAGPNGVYLTSDTGEHWRRVGAPPEGHELRALLAGPRASGRLLAGLTPAGIAHSDSGGSTWRPAAVPRLPHGAASQLAPATGDSHHLHAVVAGLLLVSADGGLTWQRVDSLEAPVTTLAMHPDSAATLYAGGPTGLHRSRNAGRTWQLLTGQPVTALLVHPARPRTLIATLAGGLHQSPNAGINWHPMNGGQADPDDPFINLAGQALGDLLLATTLSGTLVQFTEGRWQRPAMGQLPPVLVMLTATGEVAPWPGASKRAQTRRHRPARKEAAVPPASPPVQQDA